MSTGARPALTEINVDRLIAEALPSQIRALQGEIAALERQASERRAKLARLVDTALLHGIELFPQGAGPAARASEPVGTDTPPGLAGTDGVPVQRVA